MTLGQQGIACYDTTVVCQVGGHLSRLSIPGVTAVPHMAPCLRTSGHHHLPTRPAAGEPKAQVGIGWTMSSSLVFVFSPSDKAVRKIQKLRIAGVTAELDTLALERDGGNGLVGPNLHLADGIHCGCGHHPASIRFVWGLPLVLSADCVPWLSGR